MCVCARMGVCVCVCVFACVRVCELSVHLCLSVHVSQINGRQVLDYRKTLSFSTEHGPSLGSWSVSLLRALLTKESKRLGKSEGFRELQNHPFFKDVGWDRLGHGRISMPARESEVARSVRALRQFPIFFPFCPSSFFSTPANLATISSPPRAHLHVVGLSRHISLSLT